jgi:glutaminyl-peptide cyclotransferase
MRKLGLLETQPDPTPFLPETGKHHFSRGYVADDHIPFMKRGVEILHVIPTPFPPVWHTMDDDAAHLDVPTLRDWAKIMTAFVAEWMELDQLAPPQSKRDDEAAKASRPEKEL